MTSATFSFCGSSVVSRALVLLFSLYIPRAIVFSSSSSSSRLLEIFWISSPFDRVHRGRRWWHRPIAGYLIIRGLNQIPLSLCLFFFKNFNFFKRNFFFLKNRPKGKRKHQRSVPFSVFLKNNPTTSEFAFHQQILRYQFASSAHLDSLQLSRRACQGNFRVLFFFFYYRHRRHPFWVGWERRKLMRKTMGRVLLMGSLAAGGGPTSSSWQLIDDQRIYVVFWWWSKNKNTRWRGKLIRRWRAKMWRLNIVVWHHQLSNERKEYFNNVHPK